jgi:hypothetical protein
MRWTALALSLVAAPQIGLAQPPLPWFLDRVSDEKVGDRALLVREGNVYLSPEGPAVQRPRDAREQPPVLPLELAVIDAGMQPRVIVANDNLRIALYIDPAALAEVTLPGAIIVPTAGRIDLTPRTPGVRLAPGLRVERAGPPAGGYVKVTFDDGVWHAQGMVEMLKLGRVYRPASLPRERYQPDALLRGVPEILSEPGGKTVIAVPHDSSFPIERLGPPLRGWMLVRARGLLVEVVGWVPAEVVVAEPNAKPAREPAPAGVLEAHGKADAKRVAAATPLYDRPGGDIIGVTMSDQGVSMDEERPDGWWRSDFTTPLGDIPLWLAP